MGLENNPDLTKAQIDELQKALPKCKIQSSPERQSPLLQPPPTAFTPEPVRRRVAGMKQILLMIAVVALVGCASTPTN